MDRPLSAVVDKGRPLRLANLTFTWRAPAEDVGRVSFLASILKGDRMFLCMT
jgi:hypothetical protein